MPRRLCLGTKTRVVSLSGDYVKVEDLMPGDSLLSCDSLGNKIVSMGVSKKETARLGKARIPTFQEVLVHSEFPTSFQDTRYMELGLFEPQKVRVKDLKEEYHFFRTLALFRFSELEEEPFVIGKNCAIYNKPFPENAKKNDRRTRSLLLSGSLMADGRPPEFDYVCCSLGLDPAKKKSELLDDIATCNSCSLVKAWPEDVRESKVFWIELERDEPIFLEDFVNI
ncbi:hypothetical protein [Brazilian marseillevirus]|uniref:hypothetical protein n=1 Tax=Brazilian marseillevirus TaxID=1813599 RepID=UPI000784D1C1|nr:hypothetical protein A3303_gp112 [Brazilian marseillevirus]AMQ10620.1 hypothetical protein [Brazilian marseillevirus]